MMAQKRVYCRVWNCNKRITFTASDDSPDILSLKTEFLRVASNDAYLRKNVQNKDFIFQTADKYGKVCDIEETDKIKDASDIDVLIVEGEGEEFFNGTQFLVLNESPNLQVKISLNYFLLIL